MSKTKNKGNNKLFGIIIVVFCILGAFFIYNKIIADTKDDKVILLQYLMKILRLTKLPY